MGKSFERADEIEVPADPAQVWDAIATGPGIDSWFMGRNEVQDGSAVRQAFGGYTPEHPVTAWEPGKRLAYGGEKGPDGRFVAYEFLIEGRDSGSTVLRLVTSGFLPGDDWADEYEAMLAGGAMFRATLAEYLTHFTGRTATPVTAFGPPVPDWPAAWATLRAALGLGETVRPGDRVRITPDGLPPIDGTVYFANAQTLGIRTTDAMYRLFQGMPGCVIAMHHVFSDIDLPAVESGWQSWLDKLFA